ncbi:MAG: PD-(D/E)XK nuclease family protein [Nitrospirae bacterium]|nr:PD-(D/E)XK nuclease family protein [Nitrospirota bacterium]
MDRVDLDPSGTMALVLDYKTGSTVPFKKLKIDPMSRGKLLQLPIYALAAQLTPEEVVAFREVFQIPPGEMRNVGRIFDQARRDAFGFEPPLKMNQSPFIGIGRPRHLEHVSQILLREVSLSPPLSE